MTDLRCQGTGTGVERGPGSWKQGKGQGLHPIPVPAEDWWGGEDYRFKDWGIRRYWDRKGHLTSWDHRVRLLEGALQSPMPSDQILLNRVNN